MALHSKTQRLLMFGFIASIACCGLVGIYFLVGGDFGPLGERVLLTNLTIGGCSILAMATAMPWERRRWHPVGPLGAMAVLAALVLSLVHIWVSQGMGADMDRAVGIAWVCAVGFALLGLVSLARLRQSWRFIQLGTAVVISLLASLIVFLILFADEIEHYDVELLGRFAGILGIASACGVISLPILHRASALRVRQDVRTVELRLSLVCPRCGEQQELPAGRSRCVKCSLRFVIEIEEDNCGKCGYPLYKLESAVCPECGTPISQSPDATAAGIAAR